LSLALDVENRSKNEKIAIGSTSVANLHILWEVHSFWVIREKKNFVVMMFIGDGWLGKKIKKKKKKKNPLKEDGLD
jgi:hypothetical protein